MKLQLLVFSLLVLLSADYGLASSKSLASNKVSTTTKPLDKTTYPKKVSTLKKRPSKPSLKKVADITDKFKDLPADDLAFIKELDKQFKLHGGKVKIKVENDNATMSTNTKNSKRTIEGELGYGYSHNGYDYSPPKYMFYPYSQSDIAHDAPKYFLPDGKTEVSIEPSYSYELKSQAYVSHNEPQVDLPQSEEEHQQLQQPQPQQEPEQGLHQQQQHYEEPVIVLRIPGPAKYASHLQTLLQQYLEIRAAQYLRILEEAEQRQHQQHQHQQLQQVDYGQAQVEQEQEHHHAQQQPESQHQPQPETQIQHEYQPQQQLQYEQPSQSAQYPDIDDVYQHYKHRHSAQTPQQAHQPEQQEPAYYVPEQQQEQHYVTEPQHQHQQQQQQPQFYYSHEQQYAQPEGPPANTYQHIYLLSMAGQSSHTGYETQHIQPELQQPVYVPEQEHQQGQVQYEEHSAPALSENNPRSSHTKVIFTHNPEHGGADYSNMYPLPSIKPNERHSPKSVPDYHQDYQEQPHPHNLQQEPQETVQQYQQQQQQLDSSATAPEAAAHQQQQQVVAITQRPFNYHAHGVKPRGRGRGGHKRRSAAASVALKNADEKIREYVREKFGAQMGSASEFKTTQVIEA